MEVSPKPESPFHHLLISPEKPQGAHSGLIPSTEFVIFLHLRLPDGMHSFIISFLLYSRMIFTLEECAQFVFSTVSSRRELAGTKRSHCN